MPVFPDSFWKEELRVGFYISETMKKAWAIQLTILEEILEVADKHGIKVYLDYGTLLGAIRHHGYVPWDDDIDISVFRKDYIPLLRYLKEELPPYRDVRSIHTTSGFNQPNAVIANRAKFDIGNNPEQKPITDMHYGFPCCTWVDIFPMDYVPDDKDMWNTIRNLYMVAYDVARGMDQLKSTGELEPILSELERLTGTRLKRDENLRTSIWMLAENISCMTKKKESSNVVFYQDNIKGNPNYMRPLSVYSKTLFVEYEMIKAPVPIGYNTILRSTYGDSYYITKRGTSAHDYPHFANQERLILSYSKLGQLGDIF